MRARDGFLLAAVLTTLCGCEHSANRLRCDPYDANVAHVRARVLGDLQLPGSAVVIECKGFPLSTLDETDLEECVISLAPGDFANLFAAPRFQSDSAQRHHGLYLASVLGSQVSGKILDSRTGILVYFNEARDRVAIQAEVHGRCGRLSAII